MRIKKFYSLHIEELSDDQFFKVYSFLSDLEEEEEMQSFALYPYIEDNMIVVEYLNEEYFEKISNFLKTFNYDNKK